MLKLNERFSEKRQFYDTQQEKFEDTKGAIYKQKLYIEDQTIQ